MMRRIHAPCLLLICLCHCDEPDSDACARRTPDAELECPNLRIESVTPLRVPASGGQITVRGQGLRPDATVLLDKMPLATEFNDGALVATLGQAVPGIMRVLQVKVPAAKASAPFPRPICRYVPWNPAVAQQIVRDATDYWLEAINPTANQNLIMELRENSAIMVSIDTTSASYTRAPKKISLALTMPMIKLAPSLAAFAQLQEPGQPADMLMADNLQGLVVRCTYQESMIGEFGNRCVPRTPPNPAQKVSALALGVFNNGYLASVVAGSGSTGAFVDVVQTDRNLDRNEVSRFPIPISQLRSPTALLIAPLFPISFTAEPQILIADSDVVYVAYLKNTQRKLLSLPIGGVPSAIAAADLNADGLLDIIVAHSGGLRVFWSTPLPDPAVKPDEPPVSFRSEDVATSCSNPSQLLVKDLDGDTMPDLITVGTDAPPKLCVRFNDCAGSFEGEQTRMLAGTPSGLSAAYLDLNSSLDLVLAEKLANNSNVLEVFFNNRN